MLSRLAYVSVCTRLFSGLKFGQHGGVDLDRLLQIELRSEVVLLSRNVRVFAELPGNSILIRPAIHTSNQLLVAVELGGLGDSNLPAISAEGVQNLSMKNLAIYSCRGLGVQITDGWRSNFSQSAIVEAVGSAVEIVDSSATRYRVHLLLPKT